jgi:ornithine cyclodeaminase/alanine dehydrogenase-like protein (mu-crystallin family)
MAAIPMIGADDVAGRLDWARLVDALAEGHRGPRPELGDTFLSRGGDTLLSRAAWIDGLGVAVKSVTVLPENPARGRPSVQGAMLVFDDATGAVEAVIDSALVTKWKTASDSVFGARLLARPGARRLLIVGAGAVAESLVEAYGAVFPGIAVTVWARRPEQAEALAERVGGGIEIADALPEAVRAADIVATATMAREPLIRGAWLVPGQHLDLIGAFKSDMREADDEALRRGRLFVDSRETTIDHIGEITIPMAAGVIGPGDIAGDLYDLVAGRAGRANAEEITLFKNGGGAHLDLMTGRAILAAWRQARG